MEKKLLTIVHVGMLFVFFTLYSILCRFQVDVYNRLGICILSLFLCEALILYLNRNMILRKIDFYISSSTLKVIFGVFGSIACWFLVCLGFNLLFEGPATANEMTPGGFTYMLITDPGTILDSFRTDNDTPSVLIPFLCIISVVGFILFCGIMISVFSNIIQRRVDAYKNGAIRYTNLKNHIVIIGFDELMPSLVRQKCKESQNNILILSKKDSSTVREQVSSMLTKEEEKRIIVYCGRRDSEEELSRLNLEKAKEIYILGNRQNVGHDALNIDCLGKMRKIIKKKKQEASNMSCLRQKIRYFFRKNKNENKIRVTVMFDNYATFSAFQVSDLAEGWRESFNFTPFNFYEYWAQKVIVDHDYDGTYEEEDISYPRIEGKAPLKGTDDTVNVIIFGITSMGVAIATQAAHYLHFSRKKTDNSLRKSRITFICANAREEMEMFYSHYSNFFEIQTSYFRDYINGKGFEEKIQPTYFKGNDANFLDIEFEFINGESYHPGVRDYLKRIVKDEHRRLSIFITTGNDRRDINIGMSLPEEIYTSQTLTPVFVHQKSSGELLNLLQKTSNYKFKNIYPFGMIDTRLDLHSKNQSRAMYLNLFYSKGLSVENVDDEANLEWDNLSAAFQWSSLYSANSYELKLKELGLTDNKMDELEKGINDHLNELCEIEQNRWNVEKLLMGYRKPHKEEQRNIDYDRATKVGNVLFSQYKQQYIHDLIRPYSQLSSVKWEIEKDGTKIVKDASGTNKEMAQSIPQIEKIIQSKNS